MQRYDTWLRFYLSKRLQLFTFVPYQIHTRRESMRNTTFTGVGDMRFRILYTIINTGDSLEGKWKHSLLAGGELRLPTGKYQQRDETRKMLPPLFQIGTGAYGYGAQIMYTLRYKGFGLYSDVQYAINGINELGYRWGNQQAHSLRVFYWKNVGNISILPGTGIAFEDFAPDTEFGMQQIHTGGRTTWGHLGVDIYTDQWTLQLFVHTPLQMNIPDSMPESRWRMAIAWGYFF